MSARDRLRAAVDRLTEDEAAEALEFIVHREERNSEGPPLDDEPWTAADGAAVADVYADRAAGVAPIPFDEIKRKHGLG